MAWSQMRRCSCTALVANHYINKGNRARCTRRSPVGVRESQGLARIPETLTVAMEFLTMPTLPEQLPAVEELRKQTLR